MNSLPQRLLATGTAIRSTVRQISGSSATAILSALLVARIASLDPPASIAEAVEQQAGYNALFLVATLLALVCVAAGTQEREQAAASEQCREPLVGLASRR